MRRMVRQGLMVMMMMMMMMTFPPPQAQICCKVPNSPPCGSRSPPLPGQDDDKCISVLESGYM